MYHRRIIVSVLVLLAASVAHADELSKAIEAITHAPQYQTARWGMLVVDGQTGKTVYERDPDRFFLPASVTKLYSCANALIELGPDHRFTTPVYAQGKIADGVLDGNLILVASGDLTFGGRRKENKTLFTDSDHTYANGGAYNAKLTDSDPLFALRALAEQIAKKGIKHIRGDVFIDDRLFPRARSTGSGPEVLAPIVVNDNVVDLVITPGKKEGDAATVLLRPQSEYIKVTANIPTVAGDQSMITIREVTPGQFRLTGKIGEKATPAIRIIDMANPTSYARALFIEELRRAGIKIEADLVENKGKLPAKGEYNTQPPIASYESEPLMDVLTVTLKVSHNLYASTLPILVGLKHHAPTIDRGLQQQGKVLQSIGVDPRGVSFAGGAGGAQADSATPRTTVALLRAMAQHPHAKPYFNALPILGVDGTLADVVPETSPVRGKVRAKTGTLSWYDVQNERTLMRSKALAGELITAKGTTLYFAIFLNDVPLAPGGTTAQQGKVLGRICEIIHQHGP